MTSHLLSAVAIAAFAFAAPVLAEANTSAKAVTAGNYAIETHHTQVLFSVNHLGFTDFYGQFPGATGTLVLDPAKPAASHIDVTVPVASVDTANAKLDSELVATDWLDATKYPTMHFVSTKVTVTGAKTAKVAGDLTMHGVTKPVVFDATFEGSGVNPMSKAYTSGFRISGTIKRSDFGVTKYVPLVSDEVKLIISAAFEKTPA